MRGYSIYKYVLPLFGDVYYYRPFIYTILSISIIHGGIAAISTNHIKQIIAYSSIVHMNLGAIGLFTNKNYGVIGGLYCMISHSFISSGLFILAGVLYNRYQTYLVEKYSGIFEKAPNISMFFLILSFSNLSLPLTGNLIGEFLVFLTMSKYNNYSMIIVFIYLMLVCVYSLMLITRILFGGTKVYTNSYNKQLILLRDTTTIEYNILLMLVIITIILRALPQYFLDLLFYRII